MSVNKLDMIDRQHKAKRKRSRCIYSKYEIQFGMPFEFVIPTRDDGHSGQNEISFSTRNIKLNCLASNCSAEKIEPISNSFNYFMIHDNGL